MKIGISGGTLYIADTTQMEYNTITSWGAMKWDKQHKRLYGAATLELLDKLAELTELPGDVGISPKTGKPYVNVREYRENLRAVHDAVERERMNENPVPLCRPPVNTPLYAHQIRAVNMCLLTFGWVKPKEEKE